MIKKLAACFMMTLFSFSLHAMQQSKTSVQLAAESNYPLAQALQRDYQESLRLRKTLKKSKKYLAKIQSYEKQNICPCCDSCVLW